MPANAFINKPDPPSDAELVAALGPAKRVWDATLDDLAREYGVSAHEWKCYSRKWGWSLRAKRKDRTIIWLSPSEGSFTALFILGDKAVRAAQKSKLPRRVLTALNAAPKYPEGTGLRLQPSARDLTTLKTLAAIKIAN